MSRTLRVLALGVALAVIGPASASAAGPLPSPGGPGALPADLLPDLVTMRPTDVTLRLRGRRRILRFTNAVANRGPGPLAVAVARGDCDGNGDPRDDRVARQRVYQDEDGDRVQGADEQAFRELAAGCTRFHRRHDHWHLDDFARYSLRRPGRARTLLSSSKVTFCLTDLVEALPDLPGASRTGAFFDCGANSPQGLSVGWSDVYTSDLPGQGIDVTRVRRGVYCLVSTADPDGLLLESDEANNARGVGVALGARRAVVRRGVRCRV